MVTLNESRGTMTLFVDYGGKERGHEQLLRIRHWEGDRRATGMRSHIE